MVNLFRKLRNKIMLNGQISRYLFYVFGEILLVVIGILIALRINNWNEHQKNLVTEQEFYCKLLEDFELDRQNIDRLSRESDYKIETSKRILLDLPKLDKPKHYLIDNFIQALRTNAFTPSKVAILDITNSGNLRLIRNDTLKQKLIRYYAELDNLLFQLNINREATIGKAFTFPSEVSVGYQHADYVKAALGPEVMATLPENNWHRDPDSEIYRKFQSDLLFFVVMSDREKQQFRKIIEEMDPVYDQLLRLCTKTQAE